MLAIFVPVVVLRAIVLTSRDVRLATLQLDFVEQQRIGLMRALADARWQDIARLRHARVTNAIGSDIQRIGAATHYLLQTVVAVVMLAAQWLLTLWISPSARWSPSSCWQGARCCWCHRCAARAGSVAI